MLDYKCTDTLNDKFLIEDFFNKKFNGFFIEIGAADGVGDSSAYLLEKHFNWQGIAVEANIDFFKELEKNRKCKCINLALSNTTGRDKFIKSKDKYYSGLKKHIVPWHTKKVYEDGFSIVDIKTSTIEDFLKANECPVDIDFISIDVEGAEFEILKKFPFDKYNVDLFIVENNNSQIIDFFKFNGYFEIENPHSNAPWEKYFSKKHIPSKNTSIQIISSNNSSDIHTCNRDLDYMYVIEDVIIDNRYKNACTPLFWHNNKRVLNLVDRVRGDWQRGEEKDIYKPKPSYEDDVSKITYNKNLKITTFYDELFLLFDIFNDNVGHFAIENIPRLWYYNEHKLDIPILTVEIWDEKNVIPSLNLILSHFVEKQLQRKLKIGEVCFIKKLYIPGIYYTICDPHTEDHFSNRLLPFFDNYFNNKDLNSHNKFTYISRQDIVDSDGNKNKHWHNRVCLNEVELIDKLSEINYDSVQLKKCKTTEELLNIFTKSSKITMLMGAAAHLCIFCKDNTTINLIYNERMTWVLNWFKALAEKRNITVNFIKPDCSFFEPDTKNYLVDEGKINVPWRIDNLSEIIKLL